MAIELSAGRGVVLIRQAVFEKSGIARSDIDSRYNLTDEEFHVEEGLVVIGPLPSDDALTSLIEELEASGLTYFDDFFEMSGNWPEWLLLYARSKKTAT